MLTVIFAIAAVWIVVSIVVVACCISAAHADRAEHPEPAANAPLPVRSRAARWLAGGTGPAA